MGFVVFRTVRFVKIHLVFNLVGLRDDLDIYIDTLKLAYTSGWGTVSSDTWTGEREKIFLSPEGSLRKQAPRGPLDSLSILICSKRTKIEVSILPW